MKALVFHAPRDVRCEEVADPRLRGPADAIVRVRLAAVCGSDLHVYEGRETGLDPGTVLGHELVGEIVETGDAVRALRAGDRVVMPFTTSCGSCFFCERGLTARCERGQLFGWVERGHGLHGAQAEHVRVPLADSTLVRVPDGIPEGEALLAGDVLGTGLFAAELGTVGPGDVVAVVGCGPVGLMAVVGALERGAGRVLAIDSLASRLDLARDLGAEPVDHGRVDALEAVREATSGRGADVVLEAVGSPEATRAAFDLVRPGGTIAAVGVHNEGVFAITPGQAYDKNLTYRAGRSPARRMAEPALGILRGRRYPVGRLLSHRLPLAEGARAYAMFAAREPGCTKVLLDPQGASSPEASGAVAPARSAAS